MRSSLLDSLRKESKETQQSAAIDIATYSLDKNVSVNFAEQATPLLKDLLRTDASEKQGTAAGALARVAIDHQSLVQGIEDELVDLLDDTTIYQQHLYNAKSAILALAALEATNHVDALERAVSKYHEQDARRAWATGTLATHYLTSNETDAFDYRYIDFVCREGVTILAKHCLGNSTSKSLGDLDEDYTVAAILFDDILTKNAQYYLRDVLEGGIGSYPNKFEKIVPHLRGPIQDKQSFAGKIALSLLTEYAETDPNSLTFLMADVINYLDTVQDDQSLITGVKFISKMASVAPSQVYANREQIEKLLDHNSEEIQQQRSSIMQAMKEPNYTSTAADTLNDDETAPNNNTHGLRQDVDESEERQNSSLNKLREAAEKESVENVPENTRVATQTTQEYTRSEKVKQYVRARANGFCEGCNEPAPFTSTTGDPYLHAHHVDELSDGGSDTPKNVIALCPNCHYRVHHGQDGEEYNQRLKQKLARIEG